MVSDQNKIDTKNLSDVVHETLSIQQSSIAALQNTGTVEEVIQVANLIDEYDGRVIFSGIGKSGIVGRKISSMFNSIGIASQFIHPVEGLHGELGLISEGDIVILISNSGNTMQMVNLLKSIKPLGARTVAITSEPESKLSSRTEYHINTKISREGAIVDYVPMASSTTTMVIGDCIANVLMSIRKFTFQDYAKIHPGGIIGKRMLLNVADILDDDIPLTCASETLAEVIVKISEGNKGIAAILDFENRLKGVITDGDIRRLVQSGTNLHNTTANEVMTTNPITVTPDTRATRALTLIEEHSITCIAVTNENNKFLGLVHIHDLIREGLTNRET